MSNLVKNYNRKKISFSRGKGSYLYSTDGKKYLDFVQGIAVNSLGHSNPDLIKVLKTQAQKVWHISNAFIIPEGEKLAKKIADEQIKQNRKIKFFIQVNIGEEDVYILEKWRRRT